MEQENLNILLNELELRGFSDQLLAEEIKRLAAYNLPVFSLKRQKQFGGDRMDYRLLFKWNDEDMQFELRGVDVTHHPKIKIRSIKYLGFDTAGLNKEMARLDWKQYWERTLKGEQLPEGELKNVNHVLNALSQMLLSDAIEVILTAEALMYKYFPPEISGIFISDTDLPDHRYKRNFYYDINSYPDITAAIAYLQISGRTDSLKRQLEEFLPQQVSDSDIRNEIHSKLSNPMDEALLSFTWVTKERKVVELNIPVEQKDHWLFVSQYQIIVSQLPEVKKGIFNGVDSELLDKKLQSVDWKRDEDLAHVKNDNDIAFNSEVEMIQEELFRMVLDPEGQVIAHLLMLNYFFGVPFFEDQISPDAWDMWKALPQKVVYLTADITVDKAINMIERRPVVLNRAAKGNKPGIWHQLEFNAPGEAGRLAPISGFSVGELGEMLANIPVDVRKAAGFAQRLMDGEKIETQANSGVQVTLMMSDNADKLIICDQQGREIPFNFKLDPEWKNPTVDLPQKKVQVPYQGKKNSRQKPKGL